MIYFTCETKWVLNLSNVEQAVSPLNIKSNGGEILTFHFRTLPLFMLEAEQFVQEHRTCMYPLLPTMMGVDAELITQVMQELTELYREDEVSLSQRFAWMLIFLERTGTIKAVEKVRIEESLKMFDRLWDESPRVQKMKKQFREEAKKEIEKVRADQEVKARRSSLISVIHARFPDLTEFAQQQAEQFDKPEFLDLLIQQVAVARDANAVRVILNPGGETLE